MKSVVYTVEVEYILDYEDPEQTDEENKFSEMTDKEEIESYIADEARIGNFRIVGKEYRTYK